MRTVQSFVRGQWYSGDTEIADINPAQPSTPVARLSLANRTIAQQAVQAAADVAHSWRNTPAPGRGEILRKAADILQQRTPDVARDLALEEGKTLPEAAGETARAVAILRYFAAQTLEADGETYPSHSPRTFLCAVREPIGSIHSEVRLACALSGQVTKQPDRKSLIRERSMHHSFSPSAGCGRFQS
jgi:acyl-CoA reductase-like NAD-dependent aldehyde dehydrogenase